MSAYQRHTIFSALFHKRLDRLDPAGYLNANALPEQPITVDNLLDIAFHMTRLEPLRDNIAHGAVIERIMRQRDFWIIVPSYQGAVGVNEDGSQVWWTKDLAERVGTYFTKDRVELELLVKLSIALGLGLSRLITYVANCDNQTNGQYQEIKDSIYTITRALTGERLIQELS